MRFPQLPVEDELEIRSLFARYGHGRRRRSRLRPAVHRGRQLDPRQLATRLAGRQRPAAPEAIHGRDHLLALMEEVMKKKFRRRMHHQMTDFYAEPGASAGEAHGHRARAHHRLARRPRQDRDVRQIRAALPAHRARSWRIADMIVRVLPSAD